MKSWRALGFKHLPLKREELWWFGSGKRQAGRAKEEIFNKKKNEQTQGRHRRKIELEENMETTEVWSAADVLGGVILVSLSKWSGLGLGNETIVLGQKKICHDH